MRVLYEAVGRRIRTAREKLELSQEYLAKKIGLTRTSVTNIEKGRQRLPLHTLYKIGETLNIEAHSLLPSMEELGSNQESSSHESNFDKWLPKVIQEGEGQHGEKTELQKG